MNSPQRTSLNLQAECKKYFKAWNTNKSENLKNLFADDISLHDWDAGVEGLEEVLKANDAKFEGVESIKVNVISIDKITKQKKCYCDLEIMIITSDGTSAKIYVLDVITFNDEGKIKSIRAYKG